MTGDYLLSMQIEEAVEAGELPPPAYEHRFHPVRRWRFDWAWPDRMVALEYEGGTWDHGRHTRPLGYTADCTKYSEAAILGWTVVRATLDMAKDGTAMALLKRALA